MSAGRKEQRLFEFKSDIQNIISVSKYYAIHESEGERESDNSRVLVGWLPSPDTWEARKNSAPLSSFLLACLPAQTLTDRSKRSG